MSGKIKKVYPETCDFGEFPSSFESPFLCQEGQNFEILLRVTLVSLKSKGKHKEGSHF